MANVNNYDIGDVVRVYTATVFTNIGGNAFDPGVVTFKYKLPDGTTVTKVYETDDEVSRTGAGEYRIDIPITQAGDWFVRVEGTTDAGENQGADERRFHVMSSEVL